ncbi:MAG TPA: hypothetical protein VM580_08760 [Labilithrix sp.]|nr:hypothetical protein [Labilithrix sp.]
MKGTLRREVIAPLAIGIAACGLTLASAIDNPHRALVGWIAAYGLAAATVLAALILLMVLHLTGARWWLVLRPIFGSVAGTAPLLVLLFIPIGAAFSLAYPWASPPASDLPQITADALEHQRTWNHGAFFLARSAIYLATWTTLSVLLRRAKDAKRERVISAVGLPVLGFTVTFAAFDWLMSLVPGWTSNVFGLYFFTSGLVSAISVIAIAAWIAERSGLADLRPDHIHAIGRLLLMAVILWAYIAFFQLLLIWIANLPAEAVFYGARAEGGWVPVGVLLFAGRFVFPLFALLSRAIKRSSRMLAAVAAWLLAMTMVDFCWLTLPSLATGLAAADILPFIGTGALLWAYGVHLTMKGVVLPAPVDVREEALRYRSP